MAIQVPDFDFSQYNPRDEWNFPAQRFVHYCAEAYNVVLEARITWNARHPYPDFRTVYWAELSGHAHAVLVMAMHLRGNGGEVAWWEAQPEFSHTFDKRLIANNNRTIRKTIQLGFVQHVVRQTDILLRQIHATLSEELVAAKLPLRSILGQILKMTECESEASILTLLLIYRDSLSQEGRFCPTNGLDHQIVFGGRKFNFSANKAIQWESCGFLDEWAFSLYLLKGLKTLLYAIFETKRVSALRSLSVPYMDI